MATRLSARIARIESGAWQPSLPLLEQFLSRPGTTNRAGAKLGGAVRTLTVGPTTTPSLSAMTPTRSMPSPMRLRARVIQAARKPQTVLVRHSFHSISTAEN